MTSDDLFELRAELRRLSVAVSGLEVIVKVLADKILGQTTPLVTAKTAKRKRR